MSSLHINTDFYARVVSWLERSKPHKGAQDGSEEAKALRSDESSMQGAPTDTEGHIFNDKRKFIALKVNYYCQICRKTQSHLALY